MPVVISVIVEDVEDIADMPIGRNAIDVEDVEDKTLPGCQADILSRIELFPLSSCQVIILIARMTFHCSTSCLMS